MNKNNFHYIDVLLDQLYGVEMEEEDIEEIGLLAWERIGNKNTRLYTYSTNIIGPDNYIELPCNAVSIESITTSCEDWSRTSNKSDYGNIDNAFIENQIESEKIFNSPYYMSGKLLSYTQNGRTVYFSKNYGKVNVLYKGILADEDGLPELSDKEANAIATYLAYVDKYKEGLKTNNTVMINLATNLEQKWLKQCDQARVTHLSQNDMNQILNIRDSWNRHMYGYSYKPIP